MAKDQALPSFNDLVTRKPSDLQDMKNLNDNREMLFRALFLYNLPPDILKILYLSKSTDVKELAGEGDRVVKVSTISLE